MTLELTLQAQSQASAMQYKSSGTSGSSGSSGSDGYSGGQQDGSGTYGSDPYSDLFGGFLAAIRPQKEADRSEGIRRAGCFNKSPAHFRSTKISVAEEEYEADPTAFFRLNGKVIFER